MLASIAAMPLVQSVIKWAAIALMILLFLAGLYRRGEQAGAKAADLSRAIEVTKAQTRMAKVQRPDKAGLRDKLRRRAFGLLPFLVLVLPVAGCVEVRPSLICPPLTEFTEQQQDALVEAMDDPAFPEIVVDFLTGYSVDRDRNRAACGEKANAGD